MFYFSKVAATFLVALGQVFLSATLQIEPFVANFFRRRFIFWAHSELTIAIEHFTARAIDVIIADVSHNRRFLAFLLKFLQSCLALRLGALFVLLLFGLLLGFEIGVFGGVHLNIYL